jgi:heterodisulfide reductase subunit B
MKYFYYPGCSLEGTAREYDISTRALMQAVGAKLTDIPDWTCCGATAAEPIGSLIALALPARNLALAMLDKDSNQDVLVPCSACYLNLKKAEMAAASDPDVKARINTVLQEDGLELNGSIKARHLLDVLSQDIGAETVAPLVKKKLTDLVIAPYYGCQALRPYAVFDDPEKPKSMEPLIEATGATVHLWEMGGRCCGASHMNTKMEIGLELSAAILRAAKGADAIVTVCPLCQINLEAHQAKMSKLYNEDLNMTILYLPQLLGIAFDISHKDLGLNLNLAITDSFRSKIGYVNTI